MTAITTMVALCAVFNTSAHTGKWLLVHSQNPLDERILRLETVLTGSPITSADVKLHLLNGARINQEGKWMGAGNLMMYKATPSEKFGTNAVYVAFGYSRPSVGVVDMYGVTDSHIKRNQSKRPWQPAPDDPPIGSSSRRRASLQNTAVNVSPDADDSDDEFHMGDHGTARLPTGGVGSSTVAAAGVAAVKWTSRIPTPAAANVDTTVTDSTRKRVAGTDTCTAPSIVAATPDPPQPARLNTVLGEKQDAFYTHKDGRREAVEVRERYNESQGGGYCIYISSLGRERDIPSEKLETNPNEMAAANEVTAVLGEKMAVSVGQEGGSSEPPSASPSSYVSSTVATAGAAASVRFRGYIRIISTSRSPVGLLKGGLLSPWFLGLCLK